MSSLRKQLVYRATPKWANLREIAAIYTKAAYRREAGENVVVDHIIPLSSSHVCGLNCEANLQIISTRENSYKHNYFSVDTPCGVSAAKAQLELF